MTRKLFVGGLAWRIDDHALRQAFEGFGQVEEAKVVTDRYTGQSRGFGFVTFADETAAKSAMESMNGKEIDGRPVKVNEAQNEGGNARGPSERRPHNQNRGPKSFGGNRPQNRNRQDG